MNSTKLTTIKITEARMPHRDPVADVMMFLALNLSNDPRRVAFTNMIF